VAIIDDVLPQINTVGQMAWPMREKFNIDPTVFGNKQEAATP